MLMDKSRREKVIEQPCCGCAFFNQCGSITKSAPFNCEKRITIEELGYIPSQSQLNNLRASN